MGSWSGEPAPIEDRDNQDREDDHRRSYAPAADRVDDEKLEVG
jgi:hypothetical protein